MHWLGDRNYNRNDLGTNRKLYRIEDNYKKDPTLTETEGYKRFITKYTKKR